MEPVNFQPPAVPIDVRRLAQARIIRGLAGVSQAVVLVALYVLWKPLHIPFWTAVEWCVVSGVAIYVTLAAVAAVLTVMARAASAALLAAHSLRLSSVGVFAALRYVHGLGLVKSAVVWAGLYFMAGMLVRRIERRVRNRLQLN